MIETQEQYEAREAALLRKELAEVEKAPLPIRREAKEAFSGALISPGRVAERINWLLGGTYGKGAYDAAWRIMKMGVRANRHAMLSQLIAALEWGCPGEFARQAWKGLSDSRKESLAREIQAVMEQGESPPSIGADSTDQEEVDAS